MVGATVEESTISESSLYASTAPTTLTGHSTSNLSHDLLPRPPSPTNSKHSRKERSSSTFTGSLVKDLSLLLRSNSRLKCDSLTGSQAVLHPLPEDSKDQARHHSDYAHNPSQNSNNLSKLDLELRMLRERDTDKVKRSENRFYGFLRRGRLASRSAPEKRRSRSADEIAQMDQPLQSSLSLSNDVQSVHDHGPTFGTPPIKHGQINQSSRPLSTAAVISSKRLPQPPPNTSTSARHAIMNSTHVIGEQEHQKPRKKTFFGMITLPGSRRSSISRPTTPHSSSTPDNSLNSRHQRKPDLTSSSPPPPYRDYAPKPLNDTTNYRWNGDVAGQRSQPSFDNSEPDSGLGIETVVAKTKLVTIVSSQPTTLPRPHLNSVSGVHTRASSTPPRVGNGVDKPKRPTTEEPEHPRLQDPSTSGRRSPLMVLASTAFGGRKGKERERSVDRTKDIRKTTPAPTSENEKGRESRNSKQNTISGPMHLGVSRGRIKHGSFDFERPLSTSVGYPARDARWSSSGPYRTSGESERTATPHGNGHPWNGPNVSTYPIQEERSNLGRSHSTKDSDRDRCQPKIRFADETKGTQIRSRNPYDTRSRAQPPPQLPSSLPSKSPLNGSGRFGNGNLVQARSNLPYRPEGGSWGRNSAKRPPLGGTGYANGMLSFGMSATSLHLDGDTNENSSRSNSPQVVTLPMDRSAMKRNTGKGRSLDLGLELSWAPTRVKREAVMDFSEMGVRSRWREEAEMKESYRMKVLESFEQVLSENGYAKFREYVQRFDSRLIPLDGPSGLMHKVRRLLDASARGLDSKEKQQLLERLDCVVQHPR